ncbi:SBBP repeat-containing protein [Methanothrix soehngenii]|uniref:SBBP repeat-containing protein n=1 Tax=Methanothrix soehngenii TaxID=2223 RepID=UPI00300D4FBE
MSGSAEVSIFNCSQDLPGSLSKERQYLSNSTEPDSSNLINNQSIDAAMLKLPLSFIENRGQSPEDVKFMVRIDGPMVLFTPSEVVFRLSCGNNSSEVHMSFENSSPGEIIGEEQLPGRANFFLGNDTSQWISDIPTFGAIRYKELYPGVDLVFKGTEGYLKHELSLDPGANLSGIVLTYSGQDKLSLAEDGSLLIETSAGNLTDSMPICYQEINGSKEMVEGRYRLVGDNGVGFEIEDYDRRYPLVIDPALATYLGGSGDDSGLSLAIDSSGNAYVAGYTASTNFPTKNPLQASNAGSSDVFVAKINSAGPALSYSTYLGGAGYDYAKGIAVDGSGNAYVTGYTASTNFPTKNPLQASKAGSNDAFIAKINSAGSALSYSTYIGGSSDDYGEGIAVDSSGNAYITGYTGSANFPTKNPIQASKAGLWDAFVSKINSAGSALVYSTYLGGSSSEYGLGIAIDSSGNAYITGPTYSTNFPTMNPLQASNGGEMDAFVSKINSAGSALTYSTYLGGSFNDFAEGIAVDSNGNSYVTGYTISNDFPTQNPIQALKNGSFDAFVTKINSAGSGLAYSTYLGGSGDCFAHGIAVDDMGNAIVTGDTSSADFPTKNPVQSSNSGSYDVFVTLIDATGSALSFSTYLGGVYHDYAKGIAIDDSNNAYLTGYTESDNFPSQNPLQAANAGYKDAFVAVISCSDPIPIGLPTVTNGIGATLVRTKSARLNGEITDTGGQNPSVTIYWGTSDGGTNIGLWTQQLSLGNLGKQTFSRDISGLNPGTIYYYRCYASNSEGASWASPTETFTTDSTASIFISLQANNGQYLCAEGGGGREVVANRDAIAAWETFGLIDQGDGYYALQADNGQYLCAEGGGGNGVVANRDWISDWETFRLIDRGNGYYALQANNGQYVCAEGGGGDEVVANRDWISDWETFRLIDLRRPARVALQASNGQYLCAEGGGGDGVAANRDWISDWETFNLLDQGNGNAAFQAFNGQYLCAEGGGGEDIVANRNAISTWETFRLIYMANDNVAIQVFNSQYACAEGGGGDGVVANRDWILAWETFKLIPI